MTTNVLGSLDINNDGYDDIVTMTGMSNNPYFGQGEIKVTLGNAAGTFHQDLSSATGGFQVTGAGDYRYLIAASGQGDVNGDGYEDLLLANQTETGAHLHLGSGDTTSRAIGSGFEIVNAGGNIMGVSFGDLNNDGYSDIVFSVESYNSGEGGIHIIWGQDTGWTGSLDLANATSHEVTTFSGSVGQTDGIGREMFVGDIDGDGVQDIGVNTQAGDLYVMDGVAINAQHGEVIGGNGNDILSSNDTAQTVRGGDGKDTLIGNGGDDTITGGEGADTYVYNSGDGSDVIDNHDTSATPETDTISFGAGITQDDLWFNMNGNDLEIGVVGTGDQVTVNNWDLGTEYQHLEVEAGGATLDVAGIENLVSAMSSFTEPGVGETIDSVNDPNDDLGTALAANWQIT